MSTLCFHSYLEIENILRVSQLGWQLAFNLDLPLDRSVIRLCFVHAQEGIAKRVDCVVGVDNNNKDPFPSCTKWQGSAAQRPGALPLLHIL